VYAYLQHREVVRFICTDFRVMNERQIRDDLGSITEHSMAMVAMVAVILLIIFA